MKKVLIAVAFIVLASLAVVGWVLPKFKPSAGAPTPDRTQTTPDQVAANMDNTTSTLVSFLNSSGATRILEKIDIFFDADDGTFAEAYQGGDQYFSCATSTLPLATSTATVALVHQTFATSTAVQHISSSTFTNAWQRVWGNGEYFNCGWSASWGLGEPGYATPSSTGGVGVDFFIK